MSHKRNFILAVLKNFWSYVVAISTVLTIYLLPSKWYAVMPWGAMILVCIAAFKVIRTNASKYEDSRNDMLEQHRNEVDKLSQQILNLQRANARLETTALEKTSRILNDLSAELRENLHTARHCWSGSPGNRSYVAPSVECWKNFRNELSTMLDYDLFAELGEIYEKIERWHRIVASPRTNPDIGNMEVDELTILAKQRLPGLVDKIDALRKKIAVV